MTLVESERGQTLKNITRKCLPWCNGPRRMA